jgi:cell division protein FtsN
LLQVLIAVIILAVLALALHFFGVIRLWGPEPAREAALPEPVPEQQPPPAPPETTAVAQTPTPLPVEKPKPRVPSSTGNFTVQVSSWQSRGKADEEAARLAGADLEAFVEEGMVDGQQWHRVRVGHYATMREASEAAAHLRTILENGAWVTKVGNQ